MKIKLSSEDIYHLCQAVATGMDRVRFITPYEEKLSGAILKSFFRKLTNRELSPGKKNSVKLLTEELLVLNNVLPQIPVSDPYSNVVLTNLIQTIDQACLSL